MGNRGVLLYVDLGKLEDEPYRLSKIYDTLGQYIDDIRRQRDIIYISKMAESLDISSLDRYRAQLVDEYDRLGTLKKILDEAYDLYKECNEKFEASGQTLCNLYAETPWYETSEGKLAIGIGVLVVTAAVAIVCPAVLGATAAAVTQSVATSALVGSAISGIMNGAASVKAGKSFFDGFASGVEEGAIIGALCGMFGAGTAAMMTGAEMTVGNVFAARVINAVGDATIGTATYIYHENKYDKAITGGDVAKTWAECAITSFVLRSVFEGGKSSSKADGKNRVMSTSKGRVESESSITCETSYGKSILNSLKNTENFTDSAIEHIFEGQVNARGKAVGYHYEGIEGTSGNVIPGTESSVNNFGVYKAQVEVNGIPKTANGGFSTFYSKNLSPQQVVDAINEAYSNCELKLGTRNTYQGVANNGMKIDMFLDQSGKIISAFPEE